jgi:outer membrane protein assembly factor BamB
MIRRGHKVAPGSPLRDRDLGTGFEMWRVTLERGRDVPTPCFEGDRVIAAGGFGSYGVHAFDASSGRALWSRHTSDDGPTAPCGVRGYVAYNTESCTLEVLHTKTGQAAWSHWLGDPMLAQPAIGGGLVFAAFPKQGAHWLGAYRLHDGGEVWAARLEHDVITAPVFAEGRLYLTTYDGSVLCLDPATGRVEWSRPQNATSAPWIYRGEAFVAQRDPVEEERAEAAGERAARRERTSSYGAARGHLLRSLELKRAAYLMRDWGAGRKAMAHAYDAEVGFGHAPAAAKLEHVEALLGEHSISRAWRHQGSRPVVVNGVLYDTTGDVLEARDLAADRLLWRWESPGAPGERALTPPAVTGSRVYVGTFDGRIVCLDAAAGTVRFQVPVGSPVHWQPALHGGRICAGLQNGDLVCIETGDPDDTGWPMWGGGAGHNGSVHASGALSPGRWGPRRVARAACDRTSGAQPA